MAKIGEDTERGGVRQWRISRLAPERRPARRSAMLIAWTTVGTSAEAERLASDVVAAGLAACVQVEGPIASHFRWEGKTERVEGVSAVFQIPARATRRTRKTRPEGASLRHARVARRARGKRGRKILVMGGGDPSLSAPLASRNPHFSTPCPSTKVSKASPASS